MKRLAIFLCCSALCLIASGRADDCCESPSVSIEKRLQQIDLEIAFKQYAKIREVRAEAELALMLLEAEVVASKEERNEQKVLLEARMAILSKHLDQLRARILDLTRELSLAAK